MKWWRIWSSATAVIYRKTASCCRLSLSINIQACAKACPTRSIRFGELEELRQDAHARVKELQDRGYDDAQIYDPRASSVGGTHAIFVIFGQPEAYNLPPSPEVPTIHMKSAWLAALLSALVVVLVIFLAFAM